MAKREASTDIWVAEQLEECDIKYDPQGSSVKEIDEALKSASKRGTGNVEAIDLAIGADGDKVSRRQLTVAWIALAVAAIALFLGILDSNIASNFVSYLGGV